MTEIALGQSAEPLVSDSRLEKIFYTMQKVVTWKLPDDTFFATFIQEPNEREKVRQAVFLVTSPHPRRKTEAMRRAKTEPKVVTLSSMPFERWREMEKEHKHYAFLTDPLRPIFAGILRRHLAHMKNLEELE
jgi:hypothetical protein